ncbi:hypothetical protein BJ973_002733 [Actinoplanes tereljensis]|uniref:Uncharacterized protein n=1 Tax=Paractinoplanes tereljensis TaxID=571912 RepID=A0A919NQI4_9ACTN|nr:hypothetical protein [Actinoplanes tereljensis]GIF22410.1 hypothetical protein Ate02nite_51400 [Actinoplanes tereljensis]
MQALALLLAASSVTWTTANSNATGDQSGSAVAANRSGGVAVVWEDAPAGDGHSDIWLRFYQNSTSAYEVKLSPGGWKHVTPDVGLDDRGNAVVVWADDPDGNGSYNVAYRVVSPTGTVTASGWANASADGNQIRPKVAVDPDGIPNTGAVGFTTVWEDIQPTTVTVRAAGFNGAKAYEKQASQTAGTHHHPDVAVGAAGDATIVWEEDADANAYYNIGLTRLARTTGSVLLSLRIANLNGGGQQTRPAIAPNANGDFAVAWESDHTGTKGVWERSFAADGTARHTEVEASTGTGATVPGIGLDDQGRVTAGWTVSAADVRVRGFNPDGTTTGRLPDSPLAWTATGKQDQLAVAVSPWNEVAVAYTDDSDGNGSDQVLLGTGATNDDGGWEPLG